MAKQPASRNRNKQRLQQQPVAKPRSDASAGTPPATPKEEVGRWESEGGAPQGGRNPTAIEEGQTRVSSSGAPPKDPRGGKHRQP